MTAFDDPVEINHDELLEVVYEIQASLKILVDRLALSRNDISYNAIQSLAYLHGLLQKDMPSLRRH